MACGNPVSVRYVDESLTGLKTVGCHDGYSVFLEWHRGFASPNTAHLMYNIYFSSVKNDIYSEGVKFTAPGNITNTFIRGGFRPGDVYYFAVRGTAFEQNTIRSDELETEQGLYIFPETSLVENITSTTTRIPVDDASIFPSYGIIQIGAELIQYSSRDLVDNLLILASVNDRGIYGYEPRLHTTDGYDGVRYYENPFVRLWTGFESVNNAVGLCDIKFQHQYAFTAEDGYREKTDLVSGNSNLAVVEEENNGFPAYDNSGYRRTYLPDLLAGKCVGSYFGGEWGCAASDENSGGLRGISVQDQMLAREEYLLQSTGEPVVLFKRKRTGIQSQHYDLYKQNTAYRGLDSYGTEIVGGYDQYFSPRRSDGKILVRFGPTKEDIKRMDEGLENSYVPDCWMLPVPAINDGDFLIRFNQDGTEEWRYEIIDVTRNKTLLTEVGAQKFTAVRVRKTDPIYQVRSFRDTSMYPSEIMTTISSVPGAIAPHTHRLIINENITNPNQINQMTSTSLSHSHPIINGLVGNVLSHSHSIILP